MTENDVIILDSVLKGKRMEYGDAVSDSDFFELYSFEQILKDYDLDYDEFNSGKVSGGDDGGIDGAFLFINDEFIDDAEGIDAAGFVREPEFDFIIIQSKRSATFSETAVDKIIKSIDDLFNFKNDLDSLKSFYNENLLNKAATFRKLILALACKHPRLNFKIYYATRGDTSAIHKKLRDKEDILKQKILGFFNNACVNMHFLGARELLELTRKVRTYTLTLNFREAYLSNGPDNYIVLATLSEYHKFITDENGSLRRYVLESNVRDFQGNVEVNRDIQSTLRDDKHLDFWWLNNGITILSSKATITGKTITLDDVQIVNGLQTTTCIHNYFATDKALDERSILIKILIVNDLCTRDKIIKATNFQTAIPPASFRAGDRIQRDIEDYLNKNGFYYERRKNYYKNLGKPMQKIVTIQGLAQGVMAIVLMEPDNARARPTTLIKRKSDYDRVFNPSFNPDVYVNCCLLLKQIETVLKQEGDDLLKNATINLRFHIAMVTVMKSLGNNSIQPRDIEKFDLSKINEEYIRSCINETKRMADQFCITKGWTVDRALKSKEFTQSIISEMAPKIVNA